MKNIMFTSRIHTKNNYNILSRHPKAHPILSAPRISRGKLLPKKILNKRKIRSQNWRNKLAKILNYYLNLKLTNPKIFRKQKK